MRIRSFSLVVGLGALMSVGACGGDDTASSHDSGGDGDGEAGDGDGDAAGDGDGDGSGDGDGDTPGDGDHDSPGVGGRAGDGDGDHWGVGGLVGDGDGDLAPDGGAPGDGGGSTGGAGGQSLGGGHCTDRVKNGAETDIDCGGPDCSPCVPFQACAVDDDCEGTCESQTCALVPHVQLLTIASDATTALTDHQVRVELSASNFRYDWVEANGANLRLSTDGQSFDVSFFIERWEVGGSSVLWVKVPAIVPQGETTLQIVSGANGLSSASDPNTTFEFYDDFEDDSWSDKWEDNGTLNSLVSESGGVLTYEGSGEWEFLATKAIFSGPVAAYATMTQELFQTTNTSHSGFTVVDDDSTFRYLFSSGNGYVRSASTVGLGGAYTSTGLDYPFVQPIFGTPHQASVAARVTPTNLEVLGFCHASDCAGSQLFPKSSGAESFDGGLRFGIASNSTAYTIVVDDFWVVKATDATLGVSIAQ